MSYIAPVDETKFWLNEVLDAKRLFSGSNFHGFKEEDLNLILSEAAKITSESIYPLNQKSDQIPAKLENGVCRQHQVLKMHMSYWSKVDGQVSQVVRNTEEWVCHLQSQVASTSILAVHVFLFRCCS